MIKKAYNLKVGDRIGNRIIAVFCSTDVNLGKNKLGLYLTNAVQFQFADKLGSDEFVTLVAETDVWVDDADNSKPCCTSTPLVATKFAANLHIGDTICMPVSRVDNKDFTVRVDIDGTEVLVFGLDEHVRVLQEAAL